MSYRIVKKAFANEEQQTRIKLSKVYQEDKEIQLSAYLTDRIVDYIDNLSQLTVSVLDQQFEDSLLDFMLGDEVDFLTTEVDIVSLIPSNF